MKKILIAYGLLVVVVIILAFAKFNGTTFFSGFGKSASAEIASQKFKIEIADDDKERQLGLSKRKSLNQDAGMLFIFPEKKKYSFWMKDTQIPLDIIFINDGKIVHIVKNAPPQAGKQGTLPIYTSPADANQVLEINGGLSDKNKFKNGDTVKITGI